MTYEAVTVENNNPTAREDETTYLTLNLGFSEAIKGDDAVRWYDDSNYTQYLRLRVVCCTGVPNSKELDYISQRVNEYSESDQSVPPQEFLNALVAASSIDSPTLNFGNQISSLLGEFGPFDVQNLTQAMKNGDSRLHFFNPDDLMSDLVVYDSPVAQMMVLDMNGTPESNPNYGRPARRRTTGILPAVQDTDGEEDPPTYHMEKAFLQPITLSFGADGQTQAQRIITITNQLSIYAFVYFDYNQFMESLDIEELPSPPDNTGLSTGMGFVTPGIFIGERTTYQTSGEQPLPATGRTSVVAPNGRSLQDTRGALILQAPPVDTSLYSTTKQLIASAGGIGTGEPPRGKAIADLVRDQNYFSNFWVSRSSTNGAQYMFAFDRRAFLEAHSLFPFLYRKQGVASRLLQPQDNSSVTAKVVNIKTKRRRLYNNRFLGDPNGFSYDKVPAGDDLRDFEVFVGTPQKVDNLFLELQDKQNKNSYVDFYEGHDPFTDNKKGQYSGLYQYGVDIVVYDPALDYLRQAFLDLNDSQSNIQSLYDYIVNSPPQPAGHPIGPGLNTNGRGLFDASAQIRLLDLSEIFLPYEGQDAQTLIDNVVSTYLSYFADLVTSGRTTLSDLRKSLEDLSSTINPDGLKALGATVGLLAEAVQKVVGTLLPGDAYLIGSIQKSKLYSTRAFETKLGLIKKGIFFDTEFDYGTLFGTGYDYIFDPRIEGPGHNTGSPQGLSVMGRPEMTSRIQSEFSKYFGYYGGQSLSGTTAANPLGTSFANSSLRFFTPRCIKTYGKSPVYQLQYKNADSNVNMYDMDRYAELFSDIMEIKRETKETYNPFYQVSPNDTMFSPNRNLANSIEDNLAELGCYAQDAQPSPFEPPQEKIFSVAKDTSTVGMTTQRSIGVDMLGSLFGSSDKATSNDVVQAQAQNLREKNRTQEDNDAYESNNVDNALAPTNLLFTLYGDLQLNSNTPQGNGMIEEAFNSLVEEANKHQATPENIFSLVEYNLVNIPNQYKSMMIQSITNEPNSFGNGFDAVRTELIQSHEGAFENSISVIKKSDNFPPFSYVTDPMKTYAKFLAFWMNYKQLAVVEYLAGFETTAFTGRPKDSVKLPQWRMFTEESWNATGRKNLLCRVRPVDWGDMNNGNSSEIGVDNDEKSILNLPIYNKYFLLKPSSDGLELTAQAFTNSGAQLGGLGSY